MSNAATRPRKHRNVLVWVLSLAAVAAFVTGVFLQDGPGSPGVQGEDVTSALISVRAGEVTAARFDDVTGVLQLDTATGVRDVVLPREYVDEATSTILEAGVPLRVSQGSPYRVTTPAGTPSTSAPRTDGDRLGSGLVFVSFILGCAALGVHIRRRSRSALNAAKSVPEAPTTRFADVAGCSEAVADLEEVVAFLKDPERFTRLGARSPRGVLLCGPPGTGKTLLARAVAGEAGVTFHAAAGSDFVEQYVGVGARRVRDLFEQARASGPAIVFIDEIDALARRRGTESSHQEYDSMLVALLAEMDGFHDSGVVVLAATNRPDVMDPAALRPGRFDRRVEVPLPDRQGREAILAAHTAGKPFSSDVDLRHVARRTPGFSGAQLANLVNEACIEAVRRDLSEVNLACMDAAVATVAMGRARTSALVTDRDRRITAWHEAGHAVAALLQDNAPDPVQVSIVPRGPAGGVTWMGGGDESFLKRSEAAARLVTMLAGRVGEEILLEGDFTQGSSGDLEEATSLATNLVTRYGMTDRGLAVRSAGSSGVDDAVEELLVTALDSARTLLTSNADLLGRVANALLESEDLNLSDLREIQGLSLPAQRSPRVVENA